MTLLLSHAVISHAIHFVLETCPHYPTLLTALLEVCLAHTLTTESHLVLHTLFLESIRSSVTSSSTSPLLHPAHINYLTTLRATCCSRDYRSSANYHRLETSTFTALLVGALSQSHVGRTDAWTSKPVARLARELLAQDFPAFLQLCTGLVDDIVEADGYQSRSRVKRKSHPPEPLEDRLRPRLARWLKSALDRLASRAAEADGGDPAVTLAYTQDLQATTDFLLHVFTTGFHRTPEPASPRRPRAMDALLCLSTYCLASPAFPAQPPSDQAAQAAALSACAPTTESFSGLVGLLFTMPPAPDPASPFDFPVAPSREPSEEGTPQPAPRLTQAEAVQVLRRYARELRAHGLFLLEASLWGNALRKVEDVLLTGGVGGANPFVPRRAAEAGPGDDLHALREELVGRVERAEARCFDAGAPQAGVNAVASVPLTGEWVWEEMVGSWVQKSPVVEPARKRRRLEPGVRRLPAMELSAPRKTRAQAAAKKTNGPAQRQRQRHSVPTTVTVLEGTSSGASSQMARSRQTTPTLVASPRRDDDEETLASSEFEDFPGLSQSKKRARRRASQSDCELRKPQAGAGCASSGEEEEEEEEERLVLPMKSRKDASHDVRPRVCAPRRTSSASSAENVKAVHVSESSSCPKPKARGSLQKVAPRRSAPTQRLASPFASASAREDSDDEFESMLPSPEDLSSDDLNLFAYPSSPVRGPAPRRRISLAH